MKAELSGARQNLAKRAEQKSLSSNKLGPHELEQSSEIVSEEWGAEEGSLFIAEAGKYMQWEDGSVYAVRDAGGKLAAVGMISKEQIDFSTWCITWLVTRKELRGKGYGSAVMCSLLKHVEAVFRQEKEGRYPADYCEVQLSTTEPEYFKRFKFKTLYTVESTPFQYRMQLFIKNGAAD